EGTLPLVLSVSDQANEPRYPSFKGIMAAKKKPVETWSLADLELTAEQVGGSSAWPEVAEGTARPARTAGTIVTDEEASGAAKVEPSAILISSNAEGKEIAARLAVKLESGLITDAVDVQEGPVTTQSVFAGNYSVKSKITKGIAIITVKPNAATPEASETS